MQAKFSEATLKQLLEDYPTLTESVAKNLICYEGVNISTRWDGQERSLLSGRIYRNPAKIHLNLPIELVLALKVEGIDLDPEILLRPDEDGNVAFEQID